MYCYGMNTGRPTPTSWSWQQQTWAGATTSTRTPAQKVAFTDSLDWVLTNYATISAGYVTSGGTTLEGTLRTNLVAFRHRARANVAFLDGHVAGQSFKDLNVFSLWN